jgi:nucleoprotein TPR
MSDAGAPATGTLHIELPPDVDADALGALLPDFDFVNVNEDSVVVLYRLILAQVADADHALREVEDVRAELERKEVELDQALQDRETAVKELEGNFEKLQDELQQVKQERDQLGA